MGWKAELLEVKPDGTRCYVAKYQYASPGMVWTRLIKRVECPKCGERGGLNVFYTRKTLDGEWRGPFFCVKHTITAHGKAEYRRLREEGVYTALAVERAVSVADNWNCWFGKEYPQPIQEPIPHPEEAVK